MSRAVPFTKAQVRRAVKAAESAGLRVVGVTVRQDGTIRIETGDKAGAAVDAPQKTLAASWDDA
ncbi:hypothetical protein JQ597_32630 [Bradyrhizobium sp. AUGA SZCCT0177]|uniref:hypothetical protein n=1 Tax=Bradyrhizobium sp. AUGA SZCCT0177 TaxID=2807665 RepID=UPI001BA6AB3D|nr:hypothetical protein [Bradyrhizobium sp. AUGA SZCCT0177]MBR1286812.1 hypothetical protein [Bradyrhizobium sp. AUGA SZCCT0177]